MIGNYEHCKQLEAIYYWGWVQDDMEYMVPLVDVVEQGFTQEFEELEEQVVATWVSNLKVEIY